uniref:Uncharacterized protein n=1 Tax=Zea mays TaxID=4577 RepID=A0A804NDS8_MAIZE
MSASLAMCVRRTALSAARLAADGALGKTALPISGVRGLEAARGWGGGGCLVLRRCSEVGWLDGGRGRVYCGARASTTDPMCRGCCCQIWPTGGATPYAAGGVLCGARAWRLLASVAAFARAVDGCRQWLRRVAVGCTRLAGAQISCVHLGI